MRHRRAIGVVVGRLLLLLVVAVLAPRSTAAIAASMTDTLDHWSRHWPVIALGRSFVAAAVRRGIVWGATS